jgi:DNA-binding HxlR family transcriptional regulator
MPTPFDAPVFPIDCEGREVFRHLTGRWGMLIVVVLGSGPARFYELRDRIGGISEKMLAQTLRALNRDGLVRRDATATIPPQVTYALTPLGYQFHSPLAELLQRINENLAAVQSARSDFDK